jgi:hypothetical protein
MNDPRSAAARGNGPRRSRETTWCLLVALAAIAFMAALFAYVLR